MSKLTSLYRQIEIINLARKAPFTRDFLENHLKKVSENREMELQISKRTLIRDLIEIETLFGLVIEFDFKSAHYHLTHGKPNEGHLELMESFDTIQAFGRANRKGGQVFFEKRLARGTEYLKPILDAIENQEAVRFGYEKYWLRESENREIRPIALKEYQHRWYLVGWTAKDELRLFGLDRIKSLEILPGKVKLPKAPKLEDRFLETLGIINEPEEPVETVILTFSEFKGKYIQSMPLHPTQDILANDGKTLQISLRVKINPELIAVILSHGDEVRVDHPERLKKLVIEKARNILESKIKSVEYYS